MNNDFTIHLGSKTRIDYLDTHDEQDFRVTLADTGQETMTGGRIKRIQRHIDGDTSWSRMATACPMWILASF